MENVYINLKSIDDENYANKIEKECKTILQEIQNFIWNIKKYILRGRKWKF